MNSFNEVFSAIKDYCKENLVFASYNLWISDINPISFDGEKAKAVLEIQSEFKYKTVNSRYMPLLKEAFVEVLGFDVDIEFVVNEPTQINIPEDIITSPINPVIDTSGSKPTNSNDYPYTFDKFIVGSNNKFAHASALAVASNPSKAYNPLFIYGNSGLGKTHLLNAIRYEISSNFPDYKIIYVDGETFTNEIINAIKTNTTSLFHEKYRPADVLLVDDIQFIAGKVSTQEEFFHTFNALYQNDKQIILASDRPPKEIKSLDDRLKTRFEMGLTADIQSPDFETRVAIINRKADTLGLEIPNDISKFIAEKITENIRQLEGVVKKMNAIWSFENAKPSMITAQRAIKDILSEKQPLPITIEKILDEVARTFNVTTEDIKSSQRTASLTKARRISIYIMRQITGLSTLEIGKEFNRDHSTVVYTLKKVEEEIEKDSYIKSTITDIIKNIKSQ